jgi:decaprenylphospho-beta-D-erythro-pentofuranosid-2-ulose 2-reductase
MKVLVLGATSAIAQAAARVWAKRGAELFLVARNGARLSAVAEDLTARGAKVLTLAQDLDDASLHEGLVENALMALGEPDVVLLAQGVMGDPAEAGDPAAAERVLRTNLVAPVQLLGLLAQRLRAGASIAAISSVAGDRGRAKNGVYGASKAGLDAFLSALRQQQRARGVQVVTLKPGFVDTPMTAGMRKSPLFASAASVGSGIVRAIDRKRDVAYLPGWWRYVMALVRAIPETFFKRMKF